MFGSWFYEKDPMVVSKFYPPEQQGKALSKIEALEEYATSFMSPIKENSISTTKPVRIMQKGMLSGKTKWYVYCDQSDGVEIELRKTKKVAESII